MTSEFGKTIYVFCISNLTSFNCAHRRSINENMENMRCNNFIHKKFDISYLKYNFKSAFGLYHDTMEAWILSLTVKKLSYINKAS